MNRVLVIQFENGTEVRFRESGPYFKVYEGWLLIFNDTQPLPIATYPQRNVARVFYRS